MSRDGKRKDDPNDNRFTVQRLFHKSIRLLLMSKRCLFGQITDVTDDDRKSVRPVSIGKQSEGKLSDKTHTVYYGSSNGVSLEAYTVRR